MSSLTKPEPAGAQPGARPPVIEVSGVDAAVRRAHQPGQRVADHGCRAVCLPSSARTAPARPPCSTA